MYVVSLEMNHTIFYYKTEKYTSLGVTNILRHSINQLKQKKNEDCIILIRQLNDSKYLSYHIKQIQKLKSR